MITLTAVALLLLFMAAIIQEQGRLVMAAASGQAASTPAKPAAKPRPRKKSAPRSPSSGKARQPKRPAKPKYSKEGLRKARRVAMFARDHLIHVDGELPPNGVAFQPIEFEDWQWENIILPIFANVDKNGRRRIKKALVGLPRDGAKSEIAAVIVLAIAFLEPKYKGQYYFVARDREQARAVFDKVATMVLHDPYLRRACTVLKDSIIITETKAKFMVLPGDAKSVQSKHADVCIVDEYHVHRTDKVLNAMMSGMIGNWDKGALMLVISTAAPVRKGPLWELWKKWKVEARKRYSSTYVYWCGASDEDDMHDPKVWRKATPMSWISDAALKENHDSLPPWEFEMYHLNRTPTSGLSKAFDAKQWDRLSDVPVIDPDRPAILAADSSFTRDTTALVLDQVDEDGIHNYLCWIIRPSEHDIVSMRRAIKTRAIQICTDYLVDRLVCDKSYFQLEMLELAGEHGIPVEVYPQSDFMMARAYDFMWAVVSNERTRHGGDEEFREQILNAGLEPTPYGPRLTKLEDALKIDAAVAAAMATVVAEVEYQEYAGGPQISVG